MLLFISSRHLVFHHGVTQTGKLKRSWKGAEDNEGENGENYGGGAKMMTPETKMRRQTPQILIFHWMSVLPLMMPKPWLKL